MNKKPFVFSINAVSGGGKTTIANELKNKLPNCEVLYFDDYDFDVKSGIDDICRWVEDGADYALWDLERFVQEITALMQKPLDYIILDYPFGYRQKQISKFINYSIFIDTPLDIAMARRILRDFDFKSAEEVFDDMKWYINRGRSTYLYGQKTGKSDADLIIDGGLPVSEIVNMIIENLPAPEDFAPPRPLSDRE